MSPKVRITLSAALLASAPLFGAYADPTPSPSGSASAGPPPVPLAAVLFTGTTSAPPEEAWKSAVELSGVRMGDGAQRNKCKVTRVAEWVRVGCESLYAGRIDLLAGEKRDLSFLGSKDGYQGENLTAQFTMRPGDRRVLQWIVPDLWEDVWPGGNGEWFSGGGQPQGPMYGVAVQVDWASGTEPLLSIF